MSDIDRADLGAKVCEALSDAGISVVLSGGSCVSVWTNNEYESKDMDFIGQTIFSNREVAKALNGIGYTQKKGNPRYFEHPDIELDLEFPSGPLMVGEEFVEDERVDSIATESGVLRLLSPTDCVKDRLAGYYHWGDEQNLQQAVSVARQQTVNWQSLQQWHHREGVGDRFEEFRSRVEKNAW